MSICTRTLHRPRLVAALALLALAGTSLATSSVAQAAPLSAVGTVSHASTSAPVAADAGSNYWTAARMRSAVSLDRAVGSRGSATTARTATDAKPDGRPGAVVGQAPKAAVKPSTTTAAGSAPRAYDSPTARTIGKLFFTRGYGAYTYNFVCTATIVNTEGKSTIWTAGRCVYGPYDGGSGTRVWDTTATFVPGYANGSAPYGRWPVLGFTTTSGWYYNGYLSDDVGVGRVSCNYGYRIADYLGAQGIRWNAVTPFVATAYGFNTPSGMISGYVSSSGGIQFLSTGVYAGSTGAPWISSFGGLYGFVSGTTSYTANGYTYGPYYGNQVAALYNAVRSQTC